MAKDSTAQEMLLAEEYFSAEDDRFGPTLRKVKDSKRLAQFAERWKRDSRP